MIDKWCPTCVSATADRWKNPCTECAEYSKWQPSELYTAYLAEKERAEKAEAALMVACVELSDHQCPDEFDLVKWDECKACAKGNEVHYDAQRDANCWRRHLLEKAAAMEIGKDGNL